MRQNLIFIVLLLVIGFFSCKNKPDIISGYGKDISITRQLSSFHFVKVDQKFKLYITQDTSLPEQIIIHYSENLIDKISTKITDGQLMIRDNNRYNWVRKLDVNPTCTLNIKKIEKLIIDGAASVECLDSLGANQIDVQMNSVAYQKIMLSVGILSGSISNTGNIKFVGRANIFTMATEDGGWFDARELSTDDAYVWHYTDRDIYISPKNIFEAAVYSAGNLYYVTEPLVRFKRETHGKGRIIKE